jgi:uncharacterized protein (TIGR02466 family)
VTAELIDFCYNLKNIDPIGENKSNAGGWHSQDIKFKKEIKELINLITQDVEKIYHELELKTKPKLHSIWCNISNSGHYHTIHRHNNCILSGVLYISKQNSHSNIVFYKEDSFKQECIFENLASNWSPLISCKHEISAVSGDCIFFPSWLKHDVSPNKIDSDRISISFNYD